MVEKILRQSRGELHALEKKALSGFEGGSVTLREHNLGWVAWGICSYISDLQRGPVRTYTFQGHRNISQSVIASRLIYYHCRVTRITDFLK